MCCRDGIRIPGSSIFGEGFIEVYNGVGFFYGQFFFIGRSDIGRTGGFGSHTRLDSGY